MALHVKNIRLFLRQDQAQFILSRFLHKPCSNKSEIHVRIDFNECNRIYHY